MSQATSEYTVAVKGTHPLSNLLVLYGFKPLDPGSKTYKLFSHSLTYFSFTACSNYSTKHLFIFKFFD